MLADAPYVVQIVARDGHFTPPTGAGLEDLTWRPGVTVRIRALPDPEDPEVSHSLFTGRVQSSNDFYNAATGAVVTQVTLIDALGDLQQHNPPALTTPLPAGMSTSERVHAALNRYGFPPARRRVQGGVHSMQSSTLAQSTLEECQRAADAEGGAFFADPDGNVVFTQRDWLVGGGPSMGNYETAVLRLGPEAYWRFSGDGRWDASGRGHHLDWPPTTAGPVTPNIVAGVIGVDQAIQMKEAAFADDPEDRFDDLVGDVTIEGWFRPPTGSDTYRFVTAAQGGNTVWEAGYKPDSSGTLYFTAGWLGSAWEPVTGIDNLDWVHFAFTLEWDGSDYELAAYLNGAAVGSTSGSASPFSPAATVVGVARAVAETSDGALSELAVYSHALTQGDVAGLYDAKDADLNSRSVNVQAHIGFPDGPPVVDARVSWDINRVRNQIAFARTGGTVQTAEDATSQAAYGKRTYQRLDFQNNSNAQVLTLAQRALAAWKDDRLRVDRVTIAARDGDPDLHKLFYDCQIGDLVEVRVNPRPGFTYDTEAHVIGLAHTITPSDWVVTLTLDDSAVAQEP